MSIGDVGIGSGNGVGESYDVRSTTYSMDLLLGLQHVGYDSDIHIRELRRRSYDVDMVLLKEIDKVLSDVDALFVRNNINAGYAITMHTTNPVASYGMSARFILNYQNRVPTDSVINAMYWSWAITLDTTYRSIAHAAKTMNVQRADEADLDILGDVYHLRRIVDETDDHYRKRLLTQTRVLIGHGTKDSCESIIDQMIGTSGCSIITGAPATIRITFENDAAMRAAYTLRDTLENVIPNMVAAGISWNLYTPIADYDVSMALFGTDECPYTMDALSQTYFSKNHTMDILNTFRFTLSYTADIMNKRAVGKEMYASMLLSGTENRSYTFDSLIAKPFNFTYSMICNNEKRNVTKTFIMDELLLRTNTQAAYDMDELVQKAKVRRYNMGLTIV